MKADTHPLYEKLKTFPLDFAEATFPFSRRLRLENGWTEDFTRRVLTEYRRFLFLAAASDHPVAPPDAVDQAWHLHMVYTRSYWDELCRETLGFPLHHGPTRGGRAEGEKFTDWYAGTLQSYRGWFGEEPPADIWLPAAERFARERNRFRRVNVSENWVIPKRLPRVVSQAMLAMPVACLPLAFGASGTDGVFAAIVLTLAVVLLVSVVASSASRTSRPSARQGTSCGGGGDGGTYIHAGGGSNHTSSGDCHDHGDSDSGGGGSDGGSSDGGSSGCGGGGCGGGGGD